jgi:ABC-type multidrug transport system ATPase subunit
MGASGCGKTTLISAMVGTTQLDSGSIEIFGKAPRKNLSRIGYMPQESSLIEEFTIREMIWFYGTIFGLSSDKIVDKISFLSELLDLTDVDKLVRDCSGGQKRRVSFAVSLVHDPELLILDEPTVGVDPVLRAKIWDYLVELTQKQNVTVLLTTHYTEEAKLSTHVGLMRNGVLIVQDKPQSILDKIGVAHLDDAFVELALIQERDSRNKTSELKMIDYSAENFQQFLMSDNEKHKNLDKHKQLNLRILIALLMKNFLQIWRNIE